MKQLSCETHGDNHREFYIFFCEFVPKLHDHVKQFIEQYDTQLSKWSMVENWKCWTIIQMKMFFLSRNKVFPCLLQQLTPPWLVQWHMLKSHSELGFSTKCYLSNKNMTSSKTSIQTLFTSLCPWTTFLCILRPPLPLLFANVRSQYGHWSRTPHRFVCLAKFNAVSRIVLHTLHINS